MRQATFLPAYVGIRCKQTECEGEVVGSSIGGEGHVCKRCNEVEWGRALHGYWPEMAQALIEGVKPAAP